MANGYRICIGCDENVLKLYCGNVCTNIDLYNLSGKNCMVYELYLLKAVIKKINLLISYICLEVLGAFQSELPK